MFTMGIIKDRNDNAGQHFFDKSTLRFFSSRFSDDVFQGPAGVFFVTSEQLKGFDCPDGKRLYTVRQFHPDTAKVSTSGKFQEHHSLRSAKCVAAATAAGHYKPSKP